MPRKIVFDTETTGLKPFQGDRITEIGCVEIIDLLPTGKTFRRYVNPEREVPQEVVRLTGLTTKFLADKPRFGEVVEDFFDFVGDSDLIAHNAAFDRDFLNNELDRIERDRLESARFIDTLALARQRFPGACNTLDALCKRFSISLSGRALHGALLDAKLLAAVYLELNGGRERRLDLSPKKRDQGIPAAPEKPRNADPEKILEASLGEAEKAAFQAALKAGLFGKSPLWNKYI